MIVTSRSDSAKVTMSIELEPPITDTILGTESINIKHLRVLSDKLRAQYLPSYSERFPKG